MALDTSTPLSVPTYVNYEARELVLLFDELFENDRNQIYAKMAADLEEAYGHEIGVDTVRGDFCRLRRFLVSHKEHVDVLAEAMALDSEMLLRVIATSDLMKRSQKGNTRGMRAECRRLILSGTVKNGELLIRLRKWAASNCPEPPSAGSLHATISTVRKEFGISDPRYYRRKLRIAA